MVVIASPMSWMGTHSQGITVFFSSANYVPRVLFCLTPLPKDASASPLKTRHSECHFFFLSDGILSKWQSPLSLGFFSRLRKKLFESLLCPDPLCLAGTQGVCTPHVTYTSAIHVIIISTLILLGGGQSCSSALASPVEWSRSR